MTQRADAAKSPVMDMLKLMALDAEDLAVISAHMQDAVLKAGDIAFWPKEGRFGLVARRFDWEGQAEGEKRRRLAGLQFGRVRAARAKGLDAREKERVLNLLSVTFQPAAPDAPKARSCSLFRVMRRCVSTLNASKRS